MKKFIIVFLSVIFGCTLFADSDGKEKEARTAPPEVIAAHKKKVRARFLADEQYYSTQERKELEELYQTWNSKKGNEQKAVAKTILRRFPKSNRAGAVLIMLAGVSSKQEELRLLRQAIRDHSDCYYGSGVQVGALARLLLGKALWRNGKKEEAKKYFDELRTSFPDAITAQMKYMVDQIPDW